MEEILKNVKLSTYLPFAKEEVIYSKDDFNSKGI